MPQNRCFARSLGLVLLFVVAGCGSTDGAAVRVLDSEGATLHAVERVEVASTERDRRLGLMGRAPLEPGQGLLLVAPVVDELCVSNRGVPFDILVIWAGPQTEDGRAPVVALEPLDAMAEEVICQPNSQYLLELPAALASALEPAAFLQLD